MKRSLRTMSFVAAALLILVASVSFAQQTGNSDKVIPGTPRSYFPQPNTYGTGTTSVNVAGMQFVPFDSTVTIGSDSAGNRTASGPIDANISFPNGASLTAIEIQGCDTSATSQPTVTFWAVDTTGATNHLSLLGTVSIGSSASSTPGCGYFAAPLPNAVTVDNYYKTYFIEVSDIPDSTAKFSAVRIYYHLQISPAPATPTFVDVPNDGSIFYQSVEALAASGITLGCDATHFCPNNSVTRLQMAVFLARALGLNWPN